MNRSPLISETLRLRRGVSVVLMILLTGSSLLIALSASARTQPAWQAPGSELFCEIDREELSEEVVALQERILSAETLEQARQIATTDSRMARDVLDRARFFAPTSESLQVASLRLDRFHTDVANASSRPEIVASLGSLTNQPRVADCDYTTGEIIAIVIGFVLGILPGIILLILLC